MINVFDIRAQAFRRYREYLSSLVLVEGQTIFPVEIRFGKVKSGEATSRYAELRNELRELKEGSDESGKPSFRVDWEERADRLAGEQLFPVRIYFPDPGSLLAFLGKGKETDRFRHDTETILAAFPVLRPWVSKKPSRIVEHIGDWERIMALARWMREHPFPGIFLREVPVIEDTKFVERKKGLLRELFDLLLDEKAIRRGASVFEERYGFRKAEPLVRVKILDRKIALRRLSGIDDLSIPISGLEGLLFPELKTILILENKTNFSNAETFLSLPALGGCAAIFGSGFAASLLGSAAVLGERHLLYWGDIDTQGLRILARIRRDFPGCESVLMDESTFDRFPEYRTDAPREASDTPPEGLVASETNLYLRLAALERRNRLEQERIPVQWARDKLMRAIGV